MLDVSVGPVSMSITVGVCPGLTLMWYHMCVVVIEHAALCEHAKPWLLITFSYVRRMSYLLAHSVVFWAWPQ